MGFAALLRVDASGVVRVANSVAESMLGPCKGQLCWDLVGALGVDARAHCAAGCTGALLERGGTDGVWRTQVAGEVTALSCSAMGSEVVVAIHRTGEQVPEAPLTPRELEVIELVAQGLTNQRISSRLDISPSTVRTHLERILDKLGVPSRAAAVTAAFGTGQLPRR